MDLSDGLQVIIDQQLSLGRSYRDIVNALEYTITELRRLDDIAFISENPLNESEKALVRGYHLQDSNLLRTTVMIDTIKSYRARVVGADLRRGKLAVDTYLKYLGERDRKIRSSATR